MRASTSLPPVFLLLLPALLGCSPLVETDGSAGAEESEIQDAPEFFERDDDIYRDLTDRCGCSTDVYADYTARLGFLRGESESMGMQLDAGCALAVLEQLESQGCEIEGSVPDCRVLVGDRQAGESCTQGVWLDDCGPSLFCLTGASSFPAEGTCAPRASLGDVCESLPHSCAEGTCIDGVCEPEATAPGDPCWLDCSGGLICADGVCREPDKCDVIPGVHP